MIWYSHKLVSGVIAYTLNLPLEGIIAIVGGSIIPDLIEFAFKLKHRGVSHFWGLYVLLLIFACFYPFAQPQIGLVLKWIFIGCLLHIVEDAMSKSGVNMFPWSSRKIKLGELYVTKQGSEFLTVAFLTIACLTIKALKVKMGLDNWIPQSELLKILS